MFVMTYHLILLTSLLAGSAYMSPMQEIIPAVINKDPPTAEVKFATGVEMNHGNELTPTQAKDQPTVVIYPFKNDALYTLIIFDPYAPTYETPTMSDIVNWLIINIPGEDIQSGEEMVAYKGPLAMPQNGMHHYMLLVYEQPGKLYLDAPRADSFHAKPRLHFNVSLFAQNYSLGEPVAGNFFVAQYDDYVPEGRARLIDIAPAPSTAQPVPEGGGNRGGSGRKAQIFLTIAACLASIFATAALVTTTS